jgi:hypothetical protein
MGNPPRVGKMLANFGGNWQENPKKNPGRLLRRSTNSGGIQKLGLQ